MIKIQKIISTIVISSLLALSMTPVCSAKSIPSAASIAAKQAKRLRLIEETEQDYERNSLIRQVKRDFSASAKFLTRAHADLVAAEFKASGYEVTVSKVYTCWLRISSWDGEEVAEAFQVRVELPKAK
jgi:hypothetical protein